MEDFPVEPVDSRNGRLSAVARIPLTEHLHRLERSRRTFLREISSLSSADWQTLRRNQEAEDCEYTPEWVFVHLIEHKLEHSEQISSLKSRW